MQVSYGEGVAIHIGPKPCADVRKGVGEASAGECAQALGVRDREAGAAAIASPWDIKPLK